MAELKDLAGWAQRNAGEDDGAALVVPPEGEDQNEPVDERTPEQILRDCITWLSTVADDIELAIPQLEDAGDLQQVADDLRVKVEEMTKKADELVEEAPEEEGEEEDEEGVEPSGA